jgi:hypothetical protein
MAKFVGHSVIPVKKLTVAKNAHGHALGNSDQNRIPDTVYAAEPGLCQ